MKQRFYLFRRCGTYYLQDARTNQQRSLDTKDRSTAVRMLEIKRQADTHDGFNQILLKTCLTTSDSMLTKRTWADVMAEMKTHGREPTRIRCERAMNCSAFKSLQHIKLVDTRAEDFLTILKLPSVSVSHYLKRLHNLAIGLGWITFPVLAPRLWPKPQTKPKRAITLAEHERILAAETNSEKKLFYQMLWEIGAAQSDAAALSADNIDWDSNCLSYLRLKTGELAQLAIGKSLSALLQQLPTSGPLFPKIAKTQSNNRAAEFYYRCRKLKIKGVSLHSYRYAWAERAKTCGYPERFAQQALGHNSKAVHRAYARRALVMIPSMEEFAERRQAASRPAVESMPLAA
jgi:integrase